MPVWTYPAVVIAVTDGDTIKAELDQGCRTFSRRAVRMEVIDAPESKDKAAWALAKSTLATILPAGTEVTVESRALDGWDRVLGVIRLADGTDVADLMLASGTVGRYSAK
jgi:endonuclease YncB( thermonuclease family)